MEGFTEEFEEGFMELLRRSHPHSRVAAKIVYNDYISDPCAACRPSRVSQVEGARGPVSKGACSSRLAAFEVEGAHVSV